MFKFFERITRRFHMADDLNNQNYSTHQSSQQNLPPTIASAATISPTGCGLFFITGTTAITKITPPLSGYHMLVLVFTNAAPGGLNTGGSGAGAIKAAITAAQNIPVVCFYDPATALYWAATGKAS